MTFTDAEIWEAGGRTEQENVADWKYEVANGDTRLGLDEWIEHQFPVVDRFGSRWKEEIELCPECKQPDNCGDCNHQPLTPDQVRWLGGVPKGREGES